MENITAWFDGFSRQISYRFDLSLFHAFDWLFLAFLCVGMFYGFKRGFLRVTVEGLEFLIVMFAVIGNYDWLAGQMNGWSNKFPLTLAKPVAYFLIFAMVWAAIIVVDQNLKGMVQAKTFPPIRALGGMFVGAVYFFFIFALVCKGLSLVPADTLVWLFNVGNTRFGNSLSQWPLEFYTFVMQKCSLLASGK